jgi:quercetin 2,3-dioxygenase
MHSYCYNSILTTIITAIAFFTPATKSFAIVQAVPSTSSSTFLKSSNHQLEADSCPAIDHNKMTPTLLRSVQRTLPRPPRHWVGDGFQVYPVFSNLAFTNDISPLLMFDYGAPTEFPPNPGTPLGVGQHPHRGFETVTVAFQGEVEHHDNAGNTGIIQAGDVQWMTAGRGIIHEEYHSKNFSKTGGTFEMCQLWVNLPKKNKMTKPGYQEILKQDIPVVNLPLGATNDAAVATARIIAGELGDTNGAARTFSPVHVWDINLPKADHLEVDLPFPAHHNCLLFVRRGSVEVVQPGQDGSASSVHQKLQPQEVALMARDGVSNTIRLRVLEPDSSVLLLGGEPLDEPIAAQGPFVMNTQQEIQQAMLDYRSGRFTAA